MMEINDLNELPIMFPWKPTFNKVVITLNTLKADGGLVLSENTMSEEQYIVAKGPYVKDMEIGDTVLIDLEKMIIPVGMEGEGSIKLNPIEHEGVTYAMIEDRLIKAVKIK